jgi:hypothetical protein
MITKKNILYACFSYVIMEITARKSARDGDSRHNRHAGHSTCGLR